MQKPSNNYRKNISVIKNALSEKEKAFLFFIDFLLSYNIRKLRSLNLIGTGNRGRTGVYINGVDKSDSVHFEADNEKDQKTKYGDTYH